MGFFKKYKAMKDELEIEKTKRQELEEKYSKAMSKIADHEEAYKLVKESLIEHSVLAAELQAKLEDQEQECRKKIKRAEGIVCHLLQGPLYFKDNGKSTFYMTAEQLEECEKLELECKKLFPQNLYQMSFRY